MTRLSHLTIGATLIMIAMGCQKLKPESVSIPEYPDLVKLMNTQIQKLQSKTVKKQVSIGGRSELKTIEMDSIKWAEELSFLKEMNPNQPEYIGAFEQSNEGSFTSLTLRKEKRGALKGVRFQKSQDQYEEIQISFHEDKDVYIHHRDIEISFIDGVISSIQINGYQKMMLKDTVRFGVEINVN